MSPEQWRSEHLTAAADQYALGIMAYALVTGRVPFEATTPFGLMHKHIHLVAGERFWWGRRQRLNVG